ncbi:hypothetical protein O181_104682 [Austropuccinia psidii MF-1]|uniref:Uncharacterized protein n=1 Tax=Austropuccinia psidii MF-1 TaxID=1389203 RepID=A0A9Q3PLP5_9BASI|nr:hypothetical protein [Austropuccinia psidii MF-1]
MVDNKDKTRETLSEVTKKKNSCHNFGSTDQYANNCPKETKKIYAIEKAQEEETQGENCESDSMGVDIRYNSEDEKYPIEEFLVEYQEETEQELQEIQFEVGQLQETESRICANTHKMHRSSY